MRDDSNIFALVLSAFAAFGARRPIRLRNGAVGPYVLLNISIKGCTNTYWHSAAYWSSCRYFHREESPSSEQRLEPRRPSAPISCRSVCEMLSTDMCVNVIHVFCTRLRLDRWYL